MKNRDLIILTCIIVSFPFFLIRVLHNMKIKDFYYSLEIHKEELNSQFLDEKNVVDYF